MKHVFVLHHERPLPDDAAEVKLIGVYSSEAGAQRAIDRLRLMPGFKEHPDNFNVDCYDLDEDNWAEGFITWTEALVTPED